MDDDHPDLNDNDIDDQDDDGTERMRRDSTGDGAEATSRVIINRDCYSMSQFHEEHGYESVGELKPKEWARKKLKRCRCGRGQIQGLLLYIFPALDWLRRYNLRSNAVGDLMAGITVSIVNIPQSMAFSLLNVLPPVYGLYTAFFAPLAFFLMGSSRHSSVGKVASSRGLLMFPFVQPRRRCTADAPPASIALNRDSKPSSWSLDSMRCLHTSGESAAQLYEGEHQEASTIFSTFGVVSILCGDAVEKIISKRYPDIEPISDIATSSSPSSTPSLSTIFPSTAVMNATTPAPCGPICDERVQMQTTLCLMVGLIQILMAICRLGFVTTYLAQPLIRAFTTGAACHVITSQVVPLFGLVLPRYSGPLSLIYTWRDIFINISQTNIATILFGLLVFSILAPGKYLSERYKHKIKIQIPWELFVVVITILISYFVNVEDKFGVDIIGDVPVGFPKPTVPSLPSGVSVGDLLGDAISIAVVGFAISVSLAKIFAAKNDYEIDANQELLAYGASNASSSFFLSFVSASALARVALLDGSGGKTQVSMLVSSIIIMFVLLFIGPLFEPLPKSVLAAIIIYALRGIVLQITEIKELFKKSKIDCSIWLVTFLSVIILGVDLGLGVGVIYGLFTVIVRTQLPNYSEQGNLADTELYRDVDGYKSVKTQPGMVIFKMQTSLYYANTQQFRKRVLKATGMNPVKRLADIRMLQATKEMNSDGKMDMTMNEIELSNDDLHSILIDCSSFDFIDVSGVKTLLAIIRDYQRVGIATVFCSCADSVMRSIKLIGDIDDETDIFYPSIHDAVISVSTKQAMKTRTSSAILSQPEEECSTVA